jgi:hypothetical protein
MDGPWRCDVIPGHFRAVSRKRALSRVPGQRQRPAPKASDIAGAPAGLAGTGNLSLAFPSRDGRRARDEEGQ